MRRALAATIAVLTTIAGLAWAGSPARGTFPAANGRIAFAADDGSGFQIYTIRPDGTRLRQVTHVAAGASQPDWGVDGRRIAFGRDHADGSSDVVVMNADGSRLRDLTRSGYDTQPAFTPDGHHLLFECDCSPQGIFRMRDNGTGRERITTHGFPQEADSDANISPDGRTVTFVRHKVEGELQALLAVDPDGSDVRRLVPYTREVAIKHDWAPDGRHIVITINADYPGGKSPNVATLRSDGSGLRLLTHFKGGRQGAFAGSYSPDGRWIVFRVENLDKDSFRLLKMHPDGSHRTLIAKLPWAPRGIDWGPRPTR